MVAAASNSSFIHEWSWPSTTCTSTVASPSHSRHVRRSTIPSTAVSREHCAFVREGEQWLVEDLGSSNGTRIGERKVDGRAPLAEKDMVKAGVARCTFHLGPIPNADEASEPTEEAAPTRTRGADDPQDAIPCSDCGKWMSIAHRLPGERMPCPFCDKRQTVPTLIS